MITHENQTVLKSFNFSFLLKYNFFSLFGSNSWNATAKTKCKGKNKYEGSFIEINGPHGIKSIVEEYFKVVKKDPRVWHKSIYKLTLTGYLLWKNKIFGKEVDEAFIIALCFGAKDFLVCEYRNNL